MRCSLHPFAFDEKVDGFETPENVLMISLQDYFASELGDISSSRFNEEGLKTLIGRMKKYLKKVNIRSQYKIIKQKIKQGYSFFLSNFLHHFQ
jgi:hypothetical protein